MSAKGFLNSWKEIAQYVGRSTRTVQRWERELGFPVHRPAGKLKSSVIAATLEIDRWIKDSPTRQSRHLPDAVSIKERPKSLLEPLLFRMKANSQRTRVREALLEAKKYRVLAARGRCKAVALLENRGLGLVILDCQPAELSTALIASKLKRRNFKAPIVICTGRQEISDLLQDLADRLATNAAAR
jgi:CheY-like chemotaxis protein